MFKSSAAFLLFILAMSCASPSQAAEAAASPASPQQNKMKTCAAQYHAKGIAKSQYRAFMSTCLKKNGTAKTAAAATKKPATTP